ncbi:hypothetical protein HBN50_17495, partial [Halobacteriovorax sp. GB3]|nr:hypothetical protein [Halobacteriovorax sp. GB3]
MQFGTKKLLFVVWLMTSLVGGTLANDPYSDSSFEDYYNDSGSSAPNAQASNDCQFIADSDSRDRCYLLRQSASIGGEVCVECLMMQPPKNDVWSERLNAVMPVVGLLGSAYLGYKSNKAWANAYEGYYNSGYEACKSNFNSYLDYSIERGATPIVAEDAQSMMQCNGNFVGGGDFAGFGGIYGSGFGGLGGNPFLSAGYTPGFLGGMMGPYFSGSGGMYPGLGIGIGGSLGGLGGYGNGIGISGGITIGGGLGGYPGIGIGGYPGGIGGGYPGIGIGIGGG